MQSVNATKMHDTTKRVTKRLTRRALARFAKRP